MTTQILSALVALLIVAAMRYIPVERINSVKKFLEIMVVIEMIRALMSF